MKIDQDLIDRGRYLNSLFDHPGFVLFIDELEGRIKANKDYLMLCQGPNEEIARFQHICKALTELRDWLDDEIEYGASEYMKKEAIHNGPSKITDPKGQSGD